MQVVIVKMVKMMMMKIPSDCFFKFYFGGWCFGTQNVSIALVTHGLAWDVYFQFELQLE